MIRLLVLAALAAFVQAPAPLASDPPIRCGDCDEWNRALEPFRLFGNTYYVGVAGLSAILVTSADGHILLDGGLPQSAPLIDANIRTLGFRTADVRLIVNSHAHYDHAGGIAALQRASKAEVAASAPGARALQAGLPTPDDPQYAFGAKANAFPAVPRVRSVADGETLIVGPLRITAHLTPGHTPGSTAWTWDACEGSRCRHMVYADSLTAVAAPGFRFTGDAKRPSIAERFRASIAKVEALPCDIVVSTHPSFTNIERKLEILRKNPASDPFLDTDGCRVYAAEARKRLEQRLADEKK